MPSREGVWDCFADDIVRAIHIGIDASAVAGTEQASFDPLASVGFLLLDRLVIQKAALAGIGLFGDDDPNAYQFGFIGQHLNEAGMRNLHKLLIVPLAHVDFLLPPVILADDEHADAFLKRAV